MASEHQQNDFAQDKSASGEHLKICILGDMSVGKTALADGYLRRTSNPGEQQFRELTLDGHNYTVEVFDPVDTDPSEPLVFHPGKGIQEADAFILLYSVTSRGSFDRLASFHSLIHAHHPSTNPPFIVVGNMCDMDRADPSAREVSGDEGRALAEKWGCAFHETSAKENLHNVERVFVELVGALRKREEGTGGNKEGGNERDEGKNKEERRRDRDEGDQHGKCCGRGCIVM
ncbi:P-loop containing nucleoside triphosphate hydrolase protein [Heliocybe sulcata]|uniref:small monomeric GTPase n=1 Tax=Heliocybe sulcata TaxID=5364 RepID=A0A5C3MSG7_9AGAM|nr:P-loop containing nucleoside triphosphate hydrolase protein [Heliocybe sulcata]